MLHRPTTPWCSESVFELLLFNSLEKCTGLMGSVDTKLWFDGGLLCTPRYKLFTIL